MKRRGLESTIVTRISAIQQALSGPNGTGKLLHMHFNNHELKIHKKKSQITFRAGLVEFRTPWNPEVTSLWMSDACSLTLPGSNWRWTARCLWRHSLHPVVPPLTRYWWAVRWLSSAMLTISVFLSHFLSQRLRLHSRCGLRATLGHIPHYSCYGRCTSHSPSATDARTGRCCPQIPLWASSNRSPEVLAGDASSSSLLHFYSKVTL